MSRLCLHPRGKHGEERRILCGGRCLPVGVFARSRTESEEQASRWGNHLMIEEVFVFKSEATQWDCERHSSLILAMNTVSQTKSLCDCQFFIIPQTRVSGTARREKLRGMNSASVIVLSVMKRCHEDHVRWARVGDMQYLMCVCRFLWRHIWSR